MGRPPKRIVRKYKRKNVSAVIDEDVKLTLEMLGFNIPRTIEELLSTVAANKKCPCCGRQVKPVITGRKVATDIEI